MQETIDSVQLNTFEVVSKSSNLKCKQKFCGFPEDKSSNRRKALIYEFTKNT